MFLTLGERTLEGSDLGLEAGAILVLLHTFRRGDVVALIERRPHPLETVFSRPEEYCTTDLEQALASIQL